MTAPFAVASPASLNQQRFTLIVNAVPGSTPRSENRRTQSLMIRKTATELQYRHLSLWVEADHLVWLHAPAAGISFARQVENHIENSDEVDESIPGMVIISLDQHVYLAEIQRGTVSREAVLVPAAAEQRLAELAQSATAFYTIDSDSALIDLAPFDPVTLSLSIITHARRNPFRFAPLWRVMLAHGLFHPAQVTLLGGPLAIALGLITAAFLYPEYVREQAQAVIQAKQRELAALAIQEQQRRSTAHAEHSASRNLRLAAEALDQARALGGDGLKTLQIDAQQITLRGQAKHFPQRVTETVRTGSWHSSLTTAGWALSHDSGFVSDQRITQTQSDTMRRTTWRLARSVSAELRIDQIEQIGRFELLSFTLSLAKPNRLALLMLAAAMQDYPYQLLQLSCQFNHWQLKTCDAQFRAKYQIGEHHVPQPTQ